MNKVILMGRLTRDPEVRYSAGNNSMAVARYTLAVDRRFRRDGENNADFIGCVAFGKSAEFAEKYGELGNIYGAQWRHWETKDGSFIDQLANVIEMIKTNPDSRRLIVSAWNPEDVPSMALPPCHTMFQFYVNEGKLSCQLYQRSADVFLGVPFNIASYALLTHLIAHETGLEVGEFVHTLGDAHLYQNHVEQMQEQLSREVRSFPTLVLNPDKASVFDFDMEDIKVEGYDPHPTIKAPIAV